MPNLDALTLVNIVGVFILKLTALIVGFLVVRMGWMLITQGTTGQFKFSARLSGFKADLVSVSPGLLFVLLGVWLMVYALYVEKSTTLTGSAVKVPPPPAVVLPDQQPESK